MVGKVIKVVGATSSGCFRRFFLFRQSTFSHVPSKLIHMMWIYYSR